MIQIDDVREAVKALESLLVPLEREVRAEGYTPGHNAIAEVLNATDELKDVLYNLEGEPAGGDYDATTASERQEAAYDSLRDLGRR